MQPVNMLQAKSTLSRLVEAIELGHEREVVIARNGRPVAKLVAMEAGASSRRLGVAKGRFEVPSLVAGQGADSMGSADGVGVI